jgi:hypothetical protein
VLLPPTPPPLPPEATAFRITFRKMTPSSPSHTFRVAAISRISTNAIQPAVRSVQSSKQKDSSLVNSAFQFMGMSRGQPLSIKHTIGISCVLLTLVYPCQGDDIHRTAVSLRNVVQLQTVPYQVWTVLQVFLHNSVV